VKEYKLEQDYGYRSLIESGAAKDPSSSSTT